MNLLTTNLTDNKENIEEPLKTPAISSFVHSFNGQIGNSPRTNLTEDAIFSSFKKFSIDSGCNRPIADDYEIAVKMFENIYIKYDKNTIYSGFLKDQVIVPETKMSKFLISKFGLQLFDALTFSFTQFAQNNKGIPHLDKVSLTRLIRSYNLPFDNLAIKKDFGSKAFINFEDFISIVYTFSKNAITSHDSILNQFESIESKSDIKNEKFECFLKKYFLENYQKFVGLQSSVTNINIKVHK